MNQRKTIIIAGIIALITAVGTTGGITFAKYYKEHSIQANDATIAKFGLRIWSDSTELFAKSYKSVSDDTTTIVVSNNDDAVIAPGTKGSMTFYVQGKAEVDAEISFHTDLSNWHDFRLVSEPLNGVRRVYDPTHWDVSVSGEGLDPNSWEQGKLIYKVGETADISIVYTWEWSNTTYTEDYVDMYDTILMELAQHSSEIGYTITDSEGYDYKVYDPNNLPDGKTIYDISILKFTEASVAISISQVIEEGEWNNA